MPLADQQITRFPNGVTNSSDQAIFASLKGNDWTQYKMDQDDFVTFILGAANIQTWTRTLVGTGTTALTAGDGGLLLLTNSAADDDLTQIQRPVANLLPVSGKKLFFKCRFAISDATQSDFAIGLQLVNADGTALTSALDGIFFLKADGAATVTLYVRKDNTTGSTNSGAMATLVAATQVELAFFYDGQLNVYYAVNGVVTGSIVLSTAAGFLPDAAVCLIASLKNGEAVAKTATIDYMFVAQER